MRAVLQRVSSARVTVAGEVTGEIGPGLLVLLGVAQDDTAADVEWLAGKVCALRVFEDDEGRMNRSVADIAGGVLLAHKASREARTAVEAICGKAPTDRKSVIPAVVFTDPEIAWMGLSEPEAKAKGVAYEKAVFPWAASGRRSSSPRPTRAWRRTTSCCFAPTVSGGRSRRARC